MYKIIRWIQNVIFCIRYWIARTRHPNYDWGDNVIYPDEVWKRWHPDDKE